jgi:phosphatidate cytidylyltransferase
MLLQRIITASILVPLVVLAVFKLPTEYFSLILALITLLAAWEWTNLAGIHSIFKRVLFLFGLIVPMLGIHFWTQFLELIAQSIEMTTDVREYSGALEWLVIAPVLFWVLVMIVIRNAPAGVLKLELKTWYKGLMGWFVLLAGWMFLSRLRTFYGAEMAMYFLVLIWAADISAYFVGKKYGNVKLAIEISPGKTVAGMYGALAAAVVCALVLSLVYGFNLVVASDFVLLSVLTVLISIYGDLFFSAAKRMRGVKDSSSLLPGHGGILDRIDSLVAAVPFFYAGVLLIYRAVE